MIFSDDGWCGADDKYGVSHVSPDRKALPPHHTSSGLGERLHTCGADDALSPIRIEVARPFVVNDAEHTEVTPQRSGKTVPAPNSMQLPNRDRAYDFYTPLTPCLAP